MDKAEFTQAQKSAPGTVTSILQTQQQFRVDYLSPAENQTVRRVSPQPIRRRRGFTLLETAMSMYILLVGVLCFCGMAVFANKVGLQSQLRGGATGLASNQLEVLRSASFDNLSTSTEKTFDIPAEFIAQLPGATNGKYQFEGKYSVDGLTSTTKKLNVIVRWRNASTHEGATVKPWSQVRLSTIVSKPGSVTAS